MAELENRLDDAEKLNARLQEEMVSMSKRVAEAEAKKPAAPSKAELDARAAQSVKLDEMSKKCLKLESENKQYLADIDGLVRQVTALKVRDRQYKLN